MKKFFNFMFLGIMFLCNAFALNAATEVATIADAKKLGSDTTIVFTGELTLQYVAVSSSGINYYAFDSNNEYVCLRCYYWADLLGTENELFVADNITISGEVTFVNDANTCATFDLDELDLATITRTGRGYRNAPSIVTIEDLMNDSARVYNANFVSIENARVESFWDIFVSPFPVNDIVVGDDRIPFVMEDIMTDFPARANILGYVGYENGAPKLYIPQFDGFVEPVAFDNISGTKHFKGYLGYDSVEFKANVLVTSVKDVDSAYVYRVQKHDVSGNPSAMQVLMPKSVKFSCLAGDSIALDVKGHYVSAIYEEMEGSLDKMSSSLFTVQKDNGTKMIVKNNQIHMSSFNAVIVADDEEHWTKYDNCLVTTLKGLVITSDELTAAGCIALRLSNAVAGKFDTVLVANTYYAEAGSPQEAIVCGFVGGYQYDDSTYYAALIPRSKNDFLSEIMEFDNIAAMKVAGSTPSRDISYKLNSPMAITGFSSITDNGYTVYMILVQDSTGAIQLNHNSKTLQNELKVGDVITGATGFFVGYAGSSYHNEEFGYVYASAPALEIDDASIVKSDEEYVAVPVEISLAELNDSYASQLITIKDVTCSKDTVILSTEDKYLPIVSQGDSWTILSDSYEYPEKLASLTGVYFLYSKMTKIIPRSEEDIVVAIEDVAVDNLVVDNNLFVQDDVVYADGAIIEVYDVMGRLVVSDTDMVNIENIGVSIVIVKTIYADNSRFVTKLVVR